MPCDLWLIAAELDPEAKDVGERPSTSKEPLRSAPSLGVDADSNLTRKSSSSSLANPRPRIATSAIDGIVCAIYCL